MRAVEACTWKNFPALEKYADETLVIFACTEENQTILHRPVEDIVKEVRHYHKQGKKFFIFQNAAECLLTWIIQKCQTVVEMCTEIPSDRFFFHNSGLESDKGYKELYDKLGWTRPMNMLISHNHEWVMKSYLMGLTRHHLPGFEPKYPIAVKTKKFVCFNKIHRGHRIKLLVTMLQLGLVDKSYYSFVGPQTVCERPPQWLNELLEHRPKEYTEREIRVLDENKRRFPMILNSSEQRHNPIDLIPSDLQYHEDSYFSIVTETMFYKKSDPEWSSGYTTAEDGIFITEKTYRPIALKHPFILLAYPHTLKFLRQRGFKTFHPFIDESYDDIELSSERFEAVVREIQRLCAFTNQQWFKWMSNIVPIVEHNYKVLQSNNDYSYKDYEPLFRR